MPTPKSRVQAIVPDKISVRRILEYAIFVVAVILVFGAISYFIVNSEWDFGDWTRYYYRSINNIKDPYDLGPGFALANPPWLFWILYPLSFLSSKISLAAWLVVTILVATWCIIRLGGDLYIVLLTLCSPAFSRLVAQGQIDVLALLGFTLILTAAGTFWKSVGYVLMAIKPSVLGAGAIVGWLKLRSGEKMIVLAAVIGVTLLSFLLHGFWPKTVYEDVTSVLMPANHGIRLWPYSIPIGLVLLGWSVKRKDERVGALSTFFLVPYLDVHSLFPYLAVLFTTIPKVWSTAIFVLLWALALFFR